MFCQSVDNCSSIWKHSCCFGLTILWQGLLLPASADNVGQGHIQLYLVCQDWAVWEDEADRNSVRSFVIGNMLDLMRVKSCHSVGDWGHDSFFICLLYLLLSSSVFWTYWLVYSVAWHMYVLSKTPRLSSRDLHKLYQESKKRDLEWELGDTREMNPRLEYNYQEMKVLAALVRFRWHSAKFKLSNHRSTAWITRGGRPYGSAWCRSRSRV